MNYLVLGTVSSEAEFQVVMTGVQAAHDNRRQVRELVEFLNMVSKSEEFGVRHEAKRWKNVAEDSAVKLYFGDPEPGQSSIWAAVAVAADLRPLTLLKITGTFAGGSHEHQSLLADALDRKAKGTVVQGQLA